VTTWFITGASSGLGAALDAIQIVRDELQGRIDEIDAWAHLSVTTGFPRSGGEEDGA
jgi:hypothetical protein